MKRSELIKQVVADHDGKYSENTVLEILHSFEAYGMLLCEKRDLGSIGKLWTPKGWDLEDDETYGN